MASAATATTAAASAALVIRERGRFDPIAAAAYSIGQQLLTTVWNIVLAVILVAAVFGPSGGRRLVEESSVQARELQAEQGK